MKITKKLLSNLLFVVLIALLLYPKSKAWILRQISFSPSIEKKADWKPVDTYQWQLQGINTENYDFNTAKGKVVLVNFWATWCPPCIAEMPSIQALYEDYGDKVTFLLVTSDGREKVLPFMEEHQYTLPVYNALSQAPQAFYTKTIPRTFLLDKKGRIVINASRANWNTSKVRALLDKLLAE